jgi:uncharacterized protein YebE (UPF0316 family)
MDLFIDLATIFTLRLIDVALATVRIVLLGRGKKGTAAALALLEGLIWVVAISRVLSAGLHDPARIVAFAAGFAAGTLVGALVEERLALGQSLVRIVAPVSTPQVADALRAEGYGATVINGDGMEGEVRLTFTVVPRKKLKEVTALVHQVNPGAYVTVDHQTSSVDLMARHGREVRT